MKRTFSLQESNTFDRIRIIFHSINRLCAIRVIKVVFSYVLGANRLQLMTTDAHLLLVSLQNQHKR